KFTQKTPLNCFNLKALITFIITKSSFYLILSPENTLRWFKEVVYQTFSKNIAFKYYENAESEVNDFKTKQSWATGSYNFSPFVDWEMEPQKDSKRRICVITTSSNYVRKRVHESENRLRFAKHVKASLKPDNEFNKLIESVISSDLEQLPENEPLRSWHINTDTIPPVVFDYFPSEFKQLRIINNKYRFILPDDAKIWFENSWESLTNDLTSPNLNKLKYNRGDEIFFLQMLCNISITEISEETWLTDTIHQFLKAAVRDIPGLSVHSTCATLSKHLGNEENRKPDRTVRLKLEDDQFEILYVEGANPELKGKKRQEDAERLQQLIKLNLDELLRDFQHTHGNKINEDIAKKIYDNPLIAIQSTQTSLISTISDRRAHPLICTTTFHNIKIPFPTKDHVLQLSRGLKLISMMWEIRNVLKIIVNNWRNILDSMEEITIIPAEQRVKIDENIPQFRNFTPGHCQPIQYSYN
ncbi:40736_t:CDS:2, partial [Gigaspora margarita]